jgi:hypothetical protein
MIAVGIARIFPSAGAARKCAHNPMFKQFKTVFTDHTRVFRIEKYF